jgi:hypothetical protein
MPYKKNTFKYEVVAFVMMAFVWSTTAATEEKKTDTVSMKVAGNNTITVNRYNPVTITCNGAIMDGRNVIKSIGPTGEIYELDCSDPPTAIYNKTLIGFIPAVTEVFFAEVCVTVQSAAKKKTSDSSSVPIAKLMSHDQYKRRLAHLGHAKRLMYELKDYAVVGVLTGGVGIGVMAAGDFLFAGKSKDELQDAAFDKLQELAHANEKTITSMKGRQDAIQGQVTANNGLITHMADQVDKLQNATQLAVDTLTASLAASTKYSEEIMAAMDKTHNDNLLLVYNNIIAVIKTIQPRSSNSTVGYRLKFSK